VWSCKSIDKSVSQLCLQNQSSKVPIPKHVSQSCPKWSQILPILSPSMSQIVVLGALWDAFGTRLFPLVYALPVNRTQVSTDKASEAWLNFVHAPKLMTNVPSTCHKSRSGDVSGTQSGPRPANGPGHTPQRVHVCIQFTTLCTHMRCTAPQQYPPPPYAVPRQPLQGSPLNLRPIPWLAP
jgi:hypothetical protein